MFWSSSLRFTSLCIFKNNPDVRWATYDPTQKNPKFKAPLAQWDGKDLCKGSANKAKGGVWETFCTTELRNTLLALNDDFESEDFSAECATAGDFPPGVKSVCLLKQQRRSKRTFGSQHKTILEIQIFQDEGDKKCHARFSTPYDR
ncbi:hypothetical protein WDU94_010207 [Cyamophila willieti]